MMAREATANREARPVVTICAIAVGLGSLIPSEARAKITFDEGPTVGALYVGCDDWLLGLPTPAATTCWLTMAGAKIDQEGACPPSTVTPEQKAFAYNRYILGQGPVARARKEELWRVFERSAWRAAWPCK